MKPPNFVTIDRCALTTFARRVWQSAILAAFLISPALAQGLPYESRSPIQFTRDNTATLVQKDVDDAQWIITYEVETGHVTGNVWFPDDGATFVECDREASNDLVDTYRCFIASGCIEEPCSLSPWSEHPEPVELPRSFFLPQIAGPGPPEPPVTDHNPTGEPGCCELSDSTGPATCFDTSTSSSPCAGAGWNFYPGATCGVTEVIPDELCLKAGLGVGCYRGACF
jgi:hypothetical protein